MRRVLAPLFTAMLILFVPQVPAAEESREEIFFRANGDYRDGNFQKAAEGYRKLIDGEGESGHLYYNLGNALFRLNDLGGAILNYERARRFIPRDPDLNFNLQYARDRARDDLPEKVGFLGEAFFWIHSVTEGELFKLFAALNVLFWGVLAGRTLLRSEWLNYAAVLFLVCWLAAGASYGVKRLVAIRSAKAVIVASEVSVRAGPHEEDTVLFKLHAGATVERERLDEDWALISIPDGKRGWIPSPGLGMVAPGE